MGGLPVSMDGGGRQGVFRSEIVPCPFPPTSQTCTHTQVPPPPPIQPSAKEPGSSPSDDPTAGGLLPPAPSLWERARLCARDLGYQLKGFVPSANSPSSSSHAKGEEESWGEDEGALQGARSAGKKGAAAGQPLLSAERILSEIGGWLRGLPPAMGLPRAMQALQ